MAARKTPNESKEVRELKIIIETQKVNLCELSETLKIIRADLQVLVTKNRELKDLSNTYQQTASRFNNLLRKEIELNHSPSSIKFLEVGQRG